MRNRFDFTKVTFSFAGSVVLWGCFGSSPQEVTPPPEPAAAVKEQPGEPKTGDQKTEPATQEASDKPVAPPGAETRNAEGRVIATGIGVRPVKTEACEWVEYAAETGQVLRRLARIPGACQKDWTLAISADGNRGLSSTNPVWLMDFGTGNAMMLPKVEDGMEVVYWHNGVPTVAGELKRTPEQTKEAEAHFEQNGLPMMFCTTQTLKDGKWILGDDPRDIGLTEGSIGPYCMMDYDDKMRLVRPLLDTYGVGYTRLDDAMVPGVQAITKNSEEFFEWAWANKSESGGIAISTIWNEGAHLTGEAAAWDGKQWRLLESVERPVSLARSLPNGDTFICAANGHGAVDTNTGKPKYWNPQGCLGLASWAEDEG